MKVKQVAPGRVCPTCFGEGGASLKQSRARCSRGWSSFVSPALWLVPWLTHKPSPPCAMAWSNMLAPPAQPREASTRAARHQEHWWCGNSPSPLPPPVFWVVLLQEVRQGWIPAMCTQVGDSAASFRTQDTTGSQNHDLEDLPPKTLPGCVPCPQPTPCATFPTLAGPWVLCPWWEGRSWDRVGEVKA